MSFEDFLTGGAPVGTPPDDDRDLMREMLDHMDQGIILYDRDAAGEDVIRLMNTKAARLLELPDSFVRPGRLRREILEACEARGDHVEPFDIPDHLRKAGAGSRIQVLVRRPSGKWVLNVSYPREDGRGSLTLHIDVSEPIAYQLSLKQSRAEYRALVETAPTGILKLDEAGRVTFANAAALELFDRPPGEIDLGEQIVPADRRPLAAHLDAGGRFEAEIPLPYFTRHVFVSISTAIGDTAAPARIITFADITALKEARTQIEHMAKHDPLTGLGNRSLFKLTWDLIEESSHLDRRPAHLIALDLDHFKQVNDEYGHGIGDMLLRQVGARLTEAAGEDGTAFRLGGDEFAILVRGGTRKRALALARRVVRHLAEPFDLAGIRASIGCSAGIASLPLDGATGEQIQRAADVALYQVKRNGRNGVACFDPAQELAMMERRRLQTDLAVAIANDDFHLVYQPEVELQTGRTIGLEALLRWHNKRLDRLVPPSVFIPIAESCGLIGLVDLWVIKNAAAQIRAFMDGGVSRPLMSINLSPITLGRIEVVGWLLDALSANGLPPEVLEVEITEGVAIGEKARVVRTLAAIRDAGIRVAIDDFGAGHTSLAYIQALPIDRVKIDRSIISGIGRDECTRAIVASIWDLCGRLGLKLTAEGIETAEQWEELKRVGPIDGQGYYLGTPQAAEIVLERLRSEGRIVDAQSRLRRLDLG